MKFAFTTTPKMLATGAVMFAVLLALGSHAVGHDWPVFIATGLLAVLAFGYSCKIDVDLQRLAGQPMPAAKPPRERTHRQDLELAMAHNMGGLVANPSYPGDIVGKNIRLALDAMLPADSAATLAADRWRMSTCQKGPSPAPVEQSIEAEIKAKGLTAPRVTLADLQANIAQTEIVKHVSPSGQVLRWAVLTTRNGFAVTGRPSAAVSPANDNAEIGEKVAIENAMQELWPLLGFRLRDQLAAHGAQ